MARAAKRPPNYQPALEAGRTPIRDSQKYTGEFYQSAFQIWYENGKPSATVLIALLQKQYPTDIMPNTTTVNAWIHDHFYSMALPLDAQVSDAIDIKLISNKISALSEHIKIGQKMQNVGMQFLDSLTDDEIKKIKLRDAIMLLVEGVRIERESLIIPKYFAELEKMDDEKLLDEIKATIKKEGLLLNPKKDE